MRMRFLIICPTLEGEYDTLDCAVCGLATYVNTQTRHKAAIVDFAFRRKGWRKYMHSRIKAFKPDIIGISTYSYFMKSVRRIAAEVKSAYPDTPVIAGGWHATLNPEETIAIEGVDMVALGEAEQIVAELLDGLEQDAARISGIKGLWTKNGSTITRNERRPFPTDLDSMPFLDWDLWEDLDKHLYFFRSIPMVGNRGCPYICTYCSVSAIRKIYSGRYYRERSPELVVEEMKLMYDKYGKKGLEWIRFADPVFTVNPVWLERFCNAYMQSGLSGKLPFSAYARADNLDDRRLQLLKKAGCRTVRIGVEAGNEYIRNEIYRKNISDGRIRQAFQMCKDNEISTVAFFIIGGPGENRRTMVETFQMLKELDPDYPAVYPYKPLPATPSVDKLMQLGGKIVTSVEDAVSTYDRYGIEMNDLNPEVVEKFKYKMYSYILVKALGKELGRRKISFLSDFPSYYIQGKKYRMTFSNIMMYYIYWR